MTTPHAYRPEIDGLRAIAVLMIMLHHAGVAWLPGGYLGVDVFFVVSGFVITRLLVADLDRGQFSLAAFWRRRVRRILPAVILLLLVVLPVGWWLMSALQFKHLMQVSLGTAALVPNVVLWNQIAYFSPDVGTRVLLHLWSLGVEEQFYLLYPLLLLALTRAGVGARGRYYRLWALGLISLTLAATLVVLDPRAGFYLLPSRVWELVAGGLAALTLWQPGVRARQVWGLVGLCLILVPMLTYGGRSPGPATVPPILGTALCLIMARGDTWVGRGLALAPMVAVGKISFGAYLWHWPLLAYARIYLADEPAMTLKLGLMVLALGLGWVSWRFVETPFRRSERPVFPRFGIGAGIVTLGLLAGIAGTAWLADLRGWRQLDWPGYQPAEIAAIEAERSVLVGSVDCHLTDESMPYEPFLAAWDCPPRDTATTRAWPVGVYGDSIGSDFVMTLRQSGRNPMQMTGYGCAIAPSQMRPDCRLMADRFRAAAQEAGLTTVILINRWQPEELTPEILVELEIWWSEVFDTVVLVAPMPQFKALDERLLRWTHDRVAALSPNFRYREAFARALKRVQGSEMQVIDAAGLFCGTRPGCSPMGDGPLLLDQHSHLTPEGALVYAKALEASGVLTALAP